MKALRGYIQTLFKSWLETLETLKVEKFSPTQFVALFELKSS
jgi:hypothetical protein